MDTVRPATQQETMARRARSLADLSGQLNELAAHWYFAGEPGVGRAVAAAAVEASKAALDATNRMMGSMEDTPR